MSGAQGLSLQHLCRAMDCLEANKEPIERELFQRVADLLNLDMEVLFHDATSLHFEIGQDDEGGGSEDIVHGSLAAGGAKYLTLGEKGLQLDAKAIKAAEHYEGEFVVRGNDDTLRAEDMALGYKQMIRVEQAWRDMKSTWGRCSTGRRTASTRKWPSRCCRCCWSAPSSMLAQIPGATPRIGCGASSGRNCRALTAPSGSSRTRRRKPPSA